MKPRDVIYNKWKRLVVTCSWRKVDFVIAGTQKGGTTALAAYLKQHSDIGIPEEKELHFFDNEDHFRNGRPPFLLYHLPFFELRSRRLWGEATPIYMYWQKSPERLRRYNPKMKLILLLRNPIARAYSHWNMERALKNEPLSFGEAIFFEQERLRGALPQQHRVFSYLDRGFYAAQLERIWAHLPRQQTLVLKSEDLKNQPQPTLDAICHFLGARPLENVQPAEVHARTYPSPMSAQERNQLQQVFEPEIRKLERLLNWDCSHWLADKSDCGQPAVQA